MNWTIREEVHFSGPYRVLHMTRGWQVWHYGNTSECFGREIRTLDAAKEIAARHERNHHNGQ